MGRDQHTPESPAKTSKPEKLMYIGPSILDPIPLAHRSVYSGLPELLKSLPPETQAAIKDCFLSLGQAGAALRELEGVKPAGQITTHYKKAQGLMRGKKK